MQLNIDFGLDNHSQLKPKLKEGKSSIPPLKNQLLKWVGNKQRFSHEICNFFPENFNYYYEPFLGSGAVLGTLSPSKAVASDVFEPLMEIWITLKENPDTLKSWYEDRWMFSQKRDKVDAYEIIKKKYNEKPNGADFLFISRSCYGGIIRFRKDDGYMSTPCGVHNPISPDSFSKRVDVWRDRVKNTTFKVGDYRNIIKNAKKGDLIYCDPPYSHCQSILYGAQKFDLRELFECISDYKSKGVYVALSIDGTKKSGEYMCDLPIPKHLFERELMVNCGRSMLRRFQLEGQSLEKENVSDRLLLTY